MTEETKVDETPAEDKTEEVPSTETKNTEGHMIPKSRFDDVNQKYKDAIKRSEALEKSAQDAETKRLKESEDYKSLYEAEQAKVIELQPKADGADSARATLKEVLDAQIELVPDDKKSLVPTHGSTEERLKWFDENRALLSKAQPFDIGGGKQGGSGDGKSVTLTPEQKEAAKKAKVSEENYAKSLET